MRARPPDTVGSLRPPQCLTIAGSDSGGGAGIQADLKTFSANGAFGLSVITSVTAQNTREVVSAFDLPVSIVRAQLEAVWDDFTIASVKTGMLSSAEIARAVGEFLRERTRPGAGGSAPSDPGRFPPIVVDPVMISKSGFPLLADEAAGALRKEILPLATVVTPNRHEAEHLAAMRIASPEDVARAADRILDLGPESVLIKGGHLDEDEAADYLFRRPRGGRGVELVERYSSPRWPGRSTHGTGCTFSAAICAGLGRGLELREAIRAAKQYVGQAIRFGLDIGHGHGPTDHFFFLRHGEETTPSPEGGAV